MDILQRPKYRVIPEIAVLNGTPYKRGDQVNFDGWPKPFELKPVNETAERIANYYGGRFKSPTLPRSPSNSLLGTIYLPAVLPTWGPSLGYDAEYGIDLPTPVLVKDVHPDMPRYRVRIAQRVGKARVEPDGEFAFLGWPTKDFFAVNQTAKVIEAYLAENAGNPNLLPSPWCMFREAIVLPDLSGRNVRAA